MQFELIVFDSTSESGHGSIVWLVATTMQSGRYLSKPYRSDVMKSSFEVEYMEELETILFVSTSLFGDSLFVFNRVGYRCIRKPYNTLHIPLSGFSKLQ